MSTPQLPRRRLLAGLGGLGVTLLAAACGEGDPASPDGAAGEGAAEGDAGEILVFSNSSPHVTAIDIRTEEISRTGDLDGFSLPGPGTTTTTSSTAATSGSAPSTPPPAPPN